MQSPWTTYTFDTEEGKTITHKIPPAFPEAEFFEISDNEFKQQKGGSDCGWWAVANILDIVNTGSAKNLVTEAKNNGAMPAEHLRNQYPLMSSYTGHGIASSTTSSSSNGENAASGAIVFSSYSEINKRKRMRASLSTQVSEDKKLER